MPYILSFLEGIITFISPCLLPMLPIYLSYFAGGGERTSRRTLINVLGFICGFTAVFVAMGALAGTLGRFLSRYQTALNIVTGAVVICFGLYFLGVFHLNFFRGIRGSGIAGSPGFFSSLLFGVIFSVGWTPCVGAFLGSALMLASQQGSMLRGILMLLLYSLGLGIPFAVSALLIDRLRGTFTAIKKHYKAINTVCGCILILLGLLMMSGLLNRILTVLG